MAAWGIENGTCVGRGYDANGFMGKLAAWAVKAPVDHGPGWFIVDDQRSQGTDPYIVFSNQAAPTPYSKAKFLRFVNMTSDPNGAGQILVQHLLYWDSVTHLECREYHRAFLRTVDGGSFAYSFRGGPEGWHILTRVTTLYSWTMLGEWEGIWDGVENFCEPETASGALTAPCPQKLNDTNSQITTWSTLTGQQSEVDANGKLYFSIVVSGSNAQVFIYNDAARTQLRGQTNNSSATGFRTVTPMNGSALGGSITIANFGAGTNATIEVVYLRLVLSAGQGATFTPGRVYFAIGITGQTLEARHVKVTAVNGDTLTVEFFGSGVIPSGAIISPYPHRQFSFSRYATNGTAHGLTVVQNRADMIYRSRFDSEVPSLATNTASLNWHGGPLLAMNPGVYGKYGMMRPWIRDINSSSFDRVYGRVRSMYVTGMGGLSVMQDRRILGGVGYICFETDGSYAYTIRDTESLS